MSAIIYTSNSTGNTQGGGAITIADTSNLAMKKASAHQISAEQTGGTAGTLAISVKPTGKTSFEALTVNGVQQIINLASPSALIFDGAIEAVKLTPTAFDGTSYSVQISGW